MIVKKILHWTSTANARDRARAAHALARAYVSRRFENEDEKAAVAAMAFLLGDPSPLVRFALARALACSPRTPRAIAFALVRDRLDTAGLVLCCSPVFRDADLVDLFADGCRGRRQAIAMRNDLSFTVCAAIAEVGERSSIVCMLENRKARIGTVAFVRLAERFRDDRKVRSLLLDRQGLPMHVRCELIERVSTTLSQSPWLSALIGKKRMSQVTQNASLDAALTLAGRVRPGEMEQLVEHFRDKGLLTTTFLMNLLCVGNIDFFASSIAKISDSDFVRVRSILVDGRKTSIQALYRSCSIGPEICEVFVEATLLWRNASRNGDIPDILEFTELLMDRLADRVESRPVSDLMSMVEGYNLEFKYQSAKAYARSIVDQAA